MQGKIKALLFMQSLIAGIIRDPLLLLNRNRKRSEVRVSDLAIAAQ